MAVQDKITICLQHGHAVSLIEATYPIVRMMKECDLYDGGRILSGFQRGTGLALANYQFENFILIRGGEPRRIQSQDSEASVANIKLMDIKKPLVVED